MTVAATERQYAMGPGRVPAGVVAPLLALAGGLAAYALGRPAPVAPGAARALSPDVLLSAFDAVLLLSLVWPGRVSGRRAWLRALVLLVVALPFHATLAAATGAGSGHAVAVAAAAVAWGVSGALGAGGNRRRHMTVLAFLTFGWPVIAYVLAEFLRVDALGTLGVSPVMFPVLLAQSAPQAMAIDALPAVVGCVLLVLASRGVWRGRVR